MKFQIENLNHIKVFYQDLDHLIIRIYLRKRMIILLMKRKLIHLKHYVCTKHLEDNVRILHVKRNTYVILKYQVAIFIL